MEQEKYTNNKLDLTDIIAKYMQLDKKEQYIDVETHNYLIYIEFIVNDNRVGEQESETGQWNITGGNIDITFKEVYITDKESDNRVEDYYINKESLIAF